MNLLCRATGGLVFTLWLGCSALAGAPLEEVQSTRAAQEFTAAARMLTPQQGLTIVNAAWEHRQKVRRKPDCSHLVHEIYRRATLPYPYASSFELYAGVENFARVKRPQPGDLIIWPGHVGIVVDPVERSFYSSVRSGLRTENYDSAYWLRRGRPRFYRYVLGSPESLTVAMARPTPPGLETPEQIITVPVVEEERETSRGAATHPAKVTSGSAATVVDDPVSAAARPAFEIPPSILIVTGRAQPTKEEIAEAISELSDAAGNVLRRDDRLKLSHPVVIFERLRVERVKVKGERGWAEIRIDFRVFLAGERIEVKQRHEKARWELRRRGSDWVVLAPLERVYVPSDVAVPVLAAQLAHLTQDDVASPDRAALVRQQAQLARVLYALLEKK